MARTPIGSLVVDMRMDLARLQSDIAKGRREFRNFARGANQSLGGINRGFLLLQRGVGAFVGIVASGRAVGAIRRMTTEVADLAEAADRVGVAAEDIQALDFGARQRGIEFNTLAQALQRASRRIGEVAQGGGELKNTMDQYGIAVRNSSGETRSTIDILEDFADVIASAESEQEKLRIAFKLFDSEGARLVTLFNQGAIGIQGFRDEARRAGAVMSEDLVRRGQELNAEFDRLALIMSTRAKEGAVLLTEAFRNLAEVLGFGGGDEGLPMTTNVEELNVELRAAERAAADARAELERFNEAVVVEGGAMTILGRGEREEAVREADRTVRAIQARIDMLNAGGGGTGGGVIAMTPQEQGVIQALRFERDQLRLTEEQQRINLELRRAATAADSEAGQEIRSLVESINARNQAEEDGNRIVEASLARQAEAQAVIDQTRTAQERYNAELAKLQVLLREGRIDQETYARAVRLADEELNRAAESTDLLADGFETGLNRAIRGSIRDFRDLGRVALNVLQDIVTAQIAAGSVGGTLSSGIGSFFSGLFGGGVAAGPANFSPQVGLFGRVQHGGRGVVQGPGGTDQSLVMLRATKGEEVTVRTPQQVAREDGGGGVQIVNSFDLRGSSPGTVAEARKFVDEIVRLSTAAIIQGAQDGGTTAKAVGRRRR